MDSFSKTQTYDLLAASLLYQHVLNITKIRERLKNKKILFNVHFMFNYVRLCNVSCNLL